MNALIDLKNRMESLVPEDRQDLFDEIFNAWMQRWVLAAENMVRVRKDQLGTSAAKVKSIADRMKDTVFTAIGRDPSLMFSQVREVGDLYEFRLALSVLRPSPVEAPPAAGNGPPSPSDDGDAPGPG